MEVRTYKLKLGVDLFDELSNVADAEDRAIAVVVRRAIARYIRDAKADPETSRRIGEQYYADPTDGMDYSLDLEAEQEGTS